ncbi:MAG: MBL fold metallo-hydrolase [Candidatus Fimivivens sp.]|nr:MBL fold metallo-hydrolase [Candidatus Fimivivens sp.]
MNILTYPSPCLQSNMYVLAESGKAIIIDPHCENGYYQKIAKVADRVDYIILTHEHYDHISGTSEMRAFFGCPVLTSSVCAQRICDPTANFSRYFTAFCELQNGEKLREIPQVEQYSCTADMVFEKKHIMSWQGHEIVLTETPGHSPGSICILVDNRFLFCGDTLSSKNGIFTRFPGGSKKMFNEVALPYIRALPDDVTVYPGHYESFLLTNSYMDKWFPNVPTID